MQSNADVQRSVFSAGHDRKITNGGVWVANEVVLAILTGDSLARDKKVFSNTWEPFCFAEVEYHERNDSTYPDVCASLLSRHRLEVFTLHLLHEVPGGRHGSPIATFPAVPVLRSYSAAQDERPELMTVGVALALSHERPWRMIDGLCQCARADGLRHLNSVPYDRRYGREICAMIEKREPMVHELCRASQESPNPAPLWCCLRAVIHSYKLLCDGYRADSTSLSPPLCHVAQVRNL